MDGLVKRVQHLEYVLQNNDSDEIKLSSRNKEVYDQVQQVKEAVDRLVSVDSLQVLISSLDANNLWAELDLWNVQLNQETDNPEDEKSLNVDCHPSINDKRLIIDSYVEEFSEIAGSLDTLYNSEIPSNRPLVTLASLKSQLDSMVQHIGNPIRQWEELSIRNAQAVRVLLENTVIEENEQWLRIQDRLQNIEKRIRVKEATMENKKSYK